MIYLRRNFFLQDVLDLLEEGLIDADDAWLLLNARYTPWWSDSVADLVDRFISRHTPGGDASRHIRLVYDALNLLYSRNFYPK